MLVVGGVHNPMCNRHMGPKVGAGVAEPTLSRPAGVRPATMSISATADAGLLAAHEVGVLTIYALIVFEILVEHGLVLIAEKFTRAW
jgi:hypothetical protein